MTDKKPQTGPAAPPPDDEEIADAVARLSAKWANERPANGGHRTTANGQILQTLEKGRAHMVTVEVKRSRRDPR